jgi:phytoene desaturase
MRRRLNALEPGDGDAFESVLAENRRKLDAFTPILRSPFRSVLDCLNPRLAKALPLLTPHLSVAGYLGKRFKTTTSASP